MNSALLQAPPAFRRLHAQTGLTSTHLLAGAGGDTLGLFEAGYLPLYAANHEPICIASHVANWAALGTEHHVADIAHLAMCRGPFQFSNRAGISARVQQPRVVQHIQTLIMLGSLNVAARTR